MKPPDEREGAQVATGDAPPTAPHNAESEPRPGGRGKPSDEGRFVWQSTLALERITNELGMTQAAFGVAVYVALCWLSSKQCGDPTIKASVSKIAGRARLGYRKVLETLHSLEALKLVAVQRTCREGGKPVAESEYTILTLAPIGRGGVPNGASPSSRDGRRRMPTFRKSVPYGTHSKKTSLRSDASAGANAPQASGGEVSGIEGRF